MLLLTQPGRMTVSGAVALNENVAVRQREPTDIEYAYCVGIYIIYRYASKQCLILIPIW